MDKGLAIGIDLGTTTSLASIGMPDGKPRLLRDPQGHGIIPSVVSLLPDGRILVGQRAKDRIVLDPEHTFYSTKRFIGRDMRLDENSWAAAAFSYHIVSGDNGTPCVEAYGRTYTLTDVAAMILTYMKKVAEQAAGMPVTRAVITVPANFNDVQRATTRQAGERAGFEVLRVLNEPTSAALAYGLERTKENERIAVYDFGGGTFDMTILEMRGDVYEVLATAGNTMLGGDDFDRRILDRMVHAVQESTGRHPNENQAFHQKLFLAAERLKCQLSDWLVAGYTERGVELGGKTIDFHFELSREEFNQACGDLVDTSFDVCDEALRLANCTLTSIDQIILVGGTTRVPLLRERVTKYFLRPPLANVQPDTVVSLGAAIQAFALGGGPAMWPPPERMPAAMERLAATAASEATRMVSLDAIGPGPASGSAEPPTRSLPLAAVRAAAEASAGEGPTRAVPLAQVRAAAEASASGEGPTRAVPLSAVREAAEAADARAQADASAAAAAQAAAGAGVMDPGLAAAEALLAAAEESEAKQAERVEERAVRAVDVFLE
ncbi:MAG: Hsp70 family protein [Deltaproteobacteria bacterium]|nr:Hsp70 family protein [Deltaproteobacteria bacterium]